MKNLFLSFILFSVFYTLPQEQIFSQNSLFSYEKHIDKSLDTLYYRLLFPDYNPERKIPLVVFLHGSGERGHDNEAQLKWGINEFANPKLMLQYPAIVVAPQCPDDMRWSNLEEDETTGNLTLKSAPSKTMGLVIKLIHQLIQDYPIDTNRIYITGLSMGGYGTYDAIMRYPDLFAAAIPVCGAGDTSRAASIAHIPMWIFHGADDITVDAQSSLDMFTALMKTGARPGYTQYPEVGHFSWLGVYSDPLMITWLFRQRKK